MAGLAGAGLGLTFQKFVLPFWNNRFETEEEKLTRILAGGAVSEQEMGGALWPKFAEMAGLPEDDQMPEVRQVNGLSIASEVAGVFRDLGVAPSELPDFEESRQAFYVVSSDGRSLFLNSDADWKNLPYVKASKNEEGAINQMKMFCTMRGFVESLTRIRAQEPHWAIGDVIVDGSYGLMSLGKNWQSQERVFLHGFHDGGCYFLAQMVCATLGMNELPYWDSALEGASGMVQTVMRALRITPRELVIWLKRSDTVSFLSFLVKRRSMVTGEPQPDRWAERIFCLPDAFLSLGDENALFDMMNGLRRMLP